MSNPRVVEPNWINDHQLSDAQWIEAMRGREKLNRCTRLADSLYRQLSHFARSYSAERSNALNPVLRILDLNSGIGDLLISSGVKAAKQNHDFRIALSDARPVSIAEQQALAERNGVCVQSIQMDFLNSPLPSGYDVIVCALMLHSLPERDVFRLIQSMQCAANRGAIIVDYRRSRASAFLLKTLSMSLTQSEVFRQGIAKSVQSSFTSEELRKIGSEALARPVRVKAILPCYLMMVVEDAVETELTPAFA